MQERRETFAQNCRDMFHELAQFLAAAVLRSELTEKVIVRRLRSLGFESAEPMTEPVFPIHSLTLLAFGLFAYLAVLTIFFSHMKDVPQPHSPMLGTSKVFLTRIITVGVVVWLMQTFTFFRRNAGRGEKIFFLCGVRDHSRGDRRRRMRAVRASRPGRGLAAGSVQQPAAHLPVRDPMRGVGFLLRRLAGG